LIITSAADSDPLRVAWEQAISHTAIEQLQGTEQPGQLSLTGTGNSGSRYRLPAAASSPSRRVKSLLAAEPVRTLLGFAQGSRGKSWQGDLRGKGVAGNTLKRGLGSAD